MKHKCSITDLLEFESEEAVVLRADRHAGEVQQRDAGLHLTRLLVSQDDALLRQEEDPRRTLQT